MKIAAAAIVACGVTLLGVRGADALPQFAVSAGRACDTCHVEPVGWHNPELDLRKCSLSCTACHVNPTGAGMRHEAGRFFGLQTVPMFGWRPTDDLAYVPGSESRPAAGGSLPESAPLTSSPESAESQPSSESQEFISSPESAESQPSVEDEARSLPAAGPASRYVPPPPGTPGRFAGLTPHPWFQFGTDLRMMGYWKERRSFKAFPMQLDAYLAGRPYNPDGQNAGRLTLLVNAGLRGSRDEQFDNFIDRAFVREWWALFHDLPYQLYAKVGRFLPAFGWRLDDHTTFIRQEQTFDHFRQVTGVEIGANPNYPYMHLSVFNPSSDWKEPIRKDDGVGFALSGGWRDLPWQAGASVLYEHREGVDDLWVGANWALAAMSMHWLPAWFPDLMYLGEFDVRHTAQGVARNLTGLTAFHELDWNVLRGLNVKLRYDWQDPDVDVRNDHRHRYTAGVEWYPWRYFEVILQYRHNVTFAERNFNEAFLQVHFWH